MNNFIFLKNNIRVPINENELFFDETKLILFKEDDNFIIKLDFKNRECHITLKGEKIHMPLKVLEMNHFKGQNTWELSYTLESEKDVKNIIKIGKNIE